MRRLNLSESDAAWLRSILEAKLVGLRREIDHTDSRRFREKLRDVVSTVERLLDQLSRQLPALVGEEGEPAVPSPIGHYLREHRVSYAVIHHPRAYSALREAAAAHIPGREWAKAVVFIADVGRVTRRPRHRRCPPPGSRRRRRDAIGHRSRDRAPLYRL